MPYDSERSLEISLTAATLVTRCEIHAFGVPHGEISGWRCSTRTAIGPAVEATHSPPFNHFKTALLRWTSYGMRIRSDGSIE